MFFNLNYMYIGVLGETHSTLTPSRLVLIERTFFHENIPVVIEAIISIVEIQRIIGYYC